MTAIDSGEIIEAVKSDRIGQPRPHGKVFDIGAYESNAIICKNLHTRVGRYTDRSVYVAVRPYQDI